MYEHLNPDDRAFIQDTEKRFSNARRMPDDIRTRYNQLIGAAPIVPIVPPGQQVLETYEEPKGPTRQPYIGLWVTYYSRRGEGREAKTQFPAMVLEVMGTDPRTERVMLKLAVHYNATESTDIRCMRRTEDDRYGVWEYAEDPFWKFIDMLTARIEALEAKVKNGPIAPPRPK